MSFNGTYQWSHFRTNALSYGRIPLDKVTISFYGLHVVYVLFFFKFVSNCIDLTIKKKYIFLCVRDLYMIWFY